LTKSGDFSNARVEKAIVGDYERQWTTANVPRAPRIILHADGGYCRPGPSDESWSNDKRCNRNAYTMRDSPACAMAFSPADQLHSLHRLRFALSSSLQCPS
ncbi:hypothetical protein ALC62_09774, partial [Cyphomyrmex costatus]